MPKLDLQNISPPTKTFTTAPTTPPSPPLASNMRTFTLVDSNIQITTSEVAILMLIMLIMMVLLLWILILTLNFVARYMTRNLDGGRQRRSKCGGELEKLEEGLYGLQVGGFGGKGQFGEKYGGFGENMPLLVSEGIASAVDGEESERGSGSGARRRSAE